MLCCSTLFQLKFGGNLFVFCSELVIHNVGRVDGSMPSVSFFQFLWFFLSGGEFCD